MVNKTRATVSTNGNPNQNQSWPHAFSRAWRRLHVFASNSDWLVVLFTSVAIGQSNYFGFGFTTLNWKLLYLAISRKRFMRPVTFGKTGLNPRATAEVRLKFFPITLKKESHAIGLSQKKLAFVQFQNKRGKFSSSFSQKVHL